MFGQVTLQPDSRQLDGLLALVNSLFLSEPTSDLILTVNGEFFHLHSFVMAASSDLIKRWIESPVADEPKLIKIDLPDFGVAPRKMTPVQLFKVYLKLIYCLVLPSGFQQDVVLGVAAIANFMISPGIQDMCEQHLVKNLVLREDVLRFAKLHNLTKVAAAAIRLLVNFLPENKSLIYEVDIDDMGELVKHLKPNPSTFGVSVSGSDLLNLLVLYCLNNRQIDMTGANVVVVSNLDRFRHLPTWIEKISDYWIAKDIIQAEAMLQRLVPDPLWQQSDSIDFYRLMSDLRGSLLRKLGQLQQINGYF